MSLRWAAVHSVSVRDCVCQTEHNCHVGMNCGLERMLVVVRGRGTESNVHILHVWLDAPQQGEFLSKYEQICQDVYSLVFIKVRPSAWLETGNLVIWSLPRWRDTHTGLQEWVWASVMATDMNIQYYKLNMIHIKMQTLIHQKTANKSQIQTVTIDTPEKSACFWMWTLCDGVLALSQ